MNDDDPDRLNDDRFVFESGTVANLLMHLMAAQTWQGAAIQALIIGNTTLAAEHAAKAAGLNDGAIKIVMEAVADTSDDG